MGDATTISCPHCGIVQFFNPNRVRCVRCHVRFQPLVELQVQPEPPAPAPDPPKYSTIGEMIARRIYEIRNAKRISQRSLAAAIGCPRTYITKIERMKATPTVASLARIAEGLGVEMLDLMTELETPTEVARATFGRGGIDQELISTLIDNLREISNSKRHYLIAAAQKLRRHPGQLIFSDLLKIA